MSFGLKYDTASNYAVQAVRMALRFVMIPVYLRALGVSAYGLIGFGGSMYGIMALLDFGMGYGSMKTLAESTQENRPETSRILRTVEAVYLSCALLIGVVMACASKWLATSWLHVDDPVIKGRTVLICTAIVVAVSWPQSLYGSFLAGQKQFVQRNCFEVAMDLLISGGMLYFLWLRKQGIGSYFAVMIVGMLVKTLGLRIMAWHKLPGFCGFAKRVELKGFFSYAAGVSVFSVASLVLFQVPALYISGNYSTSILGRYSVAQTVPLALLTLLYPISTASFPRLVKMRENQHASETFLKCSKFMMLITCAFGLMAGANMLAIYSLWLGSSTDIAEIASMANVILGGAVLYGTTIILVSTLLSNGHSKWVGACHLVAVGAFLLCIFTMGGHGIQGVLYAWVIANAVLLAGTVAALFRIFRQLFLLWCKMEMQTLVLLLAGVASVVILNRAFSTDTAYVRIAISGLVTTAIFAPSLARMVRRGVV